MAVQTDLSGAALALSFAKIPTACKIALCLAKTRSGGFRFHFFDIPEACCNC